MNKEQLIEEVRKYNVLYDTSDPKYSDTVKREEAWTEISNSLAAPVSICKKTWLNLREAHRRAIKKKSNTSALGAALAKKWQYEDEMSFLIPHFKTRANKSLRDSDEESTDNEDSLMDQQSDASTNEQNAQSGTSQFPHAKRQKRFLDDEPPSILKYVLEGKKKHGDEIDKFFSSMAATVKNFNEYNRAMIKSQIFNIVSQMELQEINEKRNNMPVGASGLEYTTTAIEYVPQSNAMLPCKQELPEF